MNNDFISIIIPTYNRANLLDITIESFVNQAYPKDKYEIIIADNNSVDHTKEVIDRWIEKSPVQIKYFHEPLQGVHYARNNAAFHTKGQILYYTDDDMIADENLLSEILKPFFMDDKVATATGRVLPKWEVPPPKWILDYCTNGLLSLSNPLEDFIISRNDCGVFSCHQAIKKSVLFEMGGFNPENTMGEWIGDGETGLNIKIKGAGYKFAYNGRSVIHHMIPSTRMTQRYLDSRLGNQGNCDSYTDYKKNIYSRTQLIYNIFLHAKNCMVQAFKGIIKFIIKRPTWRLSRAKVFYYLNRIKYDYRLIKEEKWRDLVLRFDWINK